MSVAEKLIAKGRIEGRIEGRAVGLSIGKIQGVQEFLALPVTLDEELCALDLEELQELHQHLQHSLEASIKRP